MGITATGVEEYELLSDRINLRVALPEVTINEARFYASPASFKGPQ